ncbi:hypothetical protein GCM10023107_38560 [Actinoplanes octamycinicus]
MALPARTLPTHRDCRDIKGIFGEAVRGSGGALVRWCVGAGGGGAGASTGRGGLRGEGLGFE